jgi:predicted ABC-type ATPase
MPQPVTINPYESCRGKSIYEGLKAWDADFKESEHPRSESGKFALKAGQTTEQAFRNEKGDWHPERQELHNKVIAKYLEGKKKRESGSPEAYVLGGGSASGKSTGFNAMYAKQFRDEVVRIDSDLLKEEIPEYGELKKRDPENAARLVHEESSHLAKQLAAIASAKKIDMIYDSTGSGGGIQGMAKTLSHEGYNVHVVYFDIPIPEARRRAEKRAERTGRHIPEEVIQNSHRGSAKNFLAMHQGKYVKTMNLYDNSERVPALVYSKKGAEPGIVVDGKKWKEYQKKAGVEAE